MVNKKSYKIYKKILDLLFFLYYNIIVINEKGDIIMDLKFYEEENKMLRQLLLHQQDLYNKLLDNYNTLLKNYDALVMETMERDLNEIKEKINGK